MVSVRSDSSHFIAAPIVSVRSDSTFSTTSTFLGKGVGCCSVVDTLLCSTVEIVFSFGSPSVSNRPVSFLSSSVKTYFLFIIYTIDLFYYNIITYK